MENGKGELYKALARVQAKLTPAVKDSKNPHLGSRYADLASCWDALRDVLAAEGLAVIQVGVVIEGRDYLATVLAHESGEVVEGVTPLLVGEPKGISAMQALGSAWTYARRYGLAAIVGMTAEDDDGHAAGAGPGPAPKAAEKAREPQAGQGALPVAPAPVGTLSGNACGTLRGMCLRHGVSAEALAAGPLAKLGVATLEAVPLADYNRLVAWVTKHPVAGASAEAGKGAPNA
jgi:hypothetical protein